MCLPYPVLLFEEKREVSALLLPTMVDIANF